MAETNRITPQQICKGCEKKFQPTRKGNAFCSPRCWRKWKWRTKDKQNLLPEILCKECGVRFIPAREWQRFCSAPCRDKSHMTNWGNARRTPDETGEEFKERVKGYNIVKQRNLVKKNRNLGLCRACPNPSVPNTKCWCEKHWFIQAAHRNGLGTKNWKLIKELLERQNYKCPYTGKNLVIGVNASIDHKNPRSRFPNQVALMKNIEWVDLDVNRAKRSLTKEEFFALCHFVVSHQTSQRCPP